MNHCFRRLRIAKSLLMFIPRAKEDRQLSDLERPHLLRNARVWNLHLSCAMSAVLFIMGSQAAPAYAAIGFGDVVLDFFDSNAGPMAGPYGGTWPGGLGFPISVSLDVVLGSEPGPTGFDDFLSLPTGSAVTIGFTDETIIDGPGDDIVLVLPEGPAEMADVFVSADGTSFSFLGTAIQNAVNTTSDESFDLALIGFDVPVTAVRIVGLDDLGASPGFDLYHVEVSADSIGPPVGDPVPGDFNADHMLDAADIDLLVGEIVADGNGSLYDLSNDGIVDNSDLDQWLREAAIANGFTASYLLGDANLDGTVDVSDLNDLGINWQRDVTRWSAGDFTADGMVEVEDLNRMGINWQQSISLAAAQSVPEPAALTLLLMCVMATPLWSHRRRAGRQGPSQHNVG